MGWYRVQRRETRFLGILFFTLHKKLHAFNFSGHFKKLNVLSNYCLPLMENFGKRVKSHSSVSNILPFQESK